MDWVATPQGMAGSITMTIHAGGRNQLNDKALQLFSVRGISPETAIAADLGSTLDGKGIIWPYIERGNLLNVKIWRPPTVKGGRASWVFSEDDNPTTFWNFDALLDPAVLRDDAPTAVVITGREWDALTAIECGYPFAVSMPNGPSNRAPAPADGWQSEDHDDENTRYDFIHRNWPSIQLVRRWIIATNDDAPGRQLAADLVRRFGAGRCSFVHYPDDCKSLNEVLRKHGNAAVTALIAAAKPYPVAGLYTLDELPNEPPRACVSTGWGNLDIGWKPYLGQFTVMTGVPGVGKTTWLCALIGQLAEIHGWVTVLGCLENSPQDYVDALTRFRLKCNPKDAGTDQIAGARAWIRKHFVFITQDVAREEDELKLDDFLKAADGAVVQHNARCVILDPFNQLDSTQERWETDTKYTERCIRSMMRFARRTRVNFNCVVHPTKSVIDIKDGDFSKLSLYHCSGSAHWANKPQAGLVFWRDQDSTTFNIKVAKNRYPESGKQWTKVSLMYEPTRGRYSEVDYG